ncbi:MAG: hypothetical protein GKS07_07460 [Nitrosopumilus sp.]|nr:MAG: hypothetical protein GKS07_07460 [Nitrosopumilus sp.]
MAKYDIFFRLIEFPFISSIIFWPAITSGQSFNFDNLGIQDAVFALLFTFFSAILIITDPGGFIFKKIVLERYKLERVLKYLNKPLKITKNDNEEEVYSFMNSLKTLSQINWFKQRHENQISKFGELINKNIYDLEIKKKLPEIQLDHEKIEMVDHEINNLKNIFEPLSKKQFYIHQGIPYVIQYFLSVKYIRHGLQTKSIEIEIDKIIATGYFFSIIVAVTLSLFHEVFSMGFYNYVVLNLDPFLSAIPGCGNSACTAGLIPNMWIIQLILLTTLIFLFLAIRKNIRSLFRKVRTTSIYIFAVNNGHFNEDVITYLKIAVDERRWELAESLSHRYVDSLETEHNHFEPFEIKNKKPNVSKSHVNTNIFILP